MTTKTTPQRKRMNATAKADKLFSLYIRNRDVYCRRCGSSNRLQCAHVWSRRYRAIRWEAANAVTLCSGCHYYFTGRPIEWQEWCQDEALDWVGLYYRALNGPTEKAVDALDRLRALSEEI